MTTSTANEDAAEQQPLRAKILRREGDRREGDGDKFSRAAVLLKLIHGRGLIDWNPAKDWRDQHIWTCQEYNFLVAFISADAYTV